VKIVEQAAVDELFARPHILHRRPDAFDAPHRSDQERFERHPRNSACAHRVAESCRSGRALSLFVVLCSASIAALSGRRRPRVALSPRDRAGAAQQSHAPLVVEKESRPHEWSRAAASVQSPEKLPSDQEGRGFSRQVGGVSGRERRFLQVARARRGVVGESGWRKTTTGRTILRLIEPTSGEIRFEGRDVNSMGTSELRALRREMQIIFQDPRSLP